MRGDQKKTPTELSSRGRAPCSAGFFSQVSALGTHLWQCVSRWWCERLCLASVNFFFEDCFNLFAHFIMVIYEHICSHCTQCSAFFDQKWLGPHAPPSLFTRSVTFIFLFVSPDERCPQRKCFADVEEVKQKMAEPLKGVKIDEFKNCFEQWETHLNRCIASNRKHFEGD